MSDVSSTPTSELKAAVETLEAFAAKLSEAQSASPVAKTISLMRSFLLGNHLETRDVKEAVEIIQRQRLFIQQLQQGSAPEKELAEAVNRAVTEYNRHFDSSEVEEKGLSKFFAKRHVAVHHSLPPIHLAPAPTVICHFPAQVPAQTHKKMFSAAIPLSKQSQELFRMKVIALLERYGIASNPEARVSVIQAPIHTAVEDESSTCTLTQTFSIFPGQTVVVKGCSVLDPKTQMISRLFPDSFSVSLESKQTGFPHPCQRSGWALAAQLIPECPQRLDLLEGARGLFQQKKQAIIDLSPNGKFVLEAKRLIKLKKLAFDSHKEECIQLHRRLALAICHAAGSDDSGLKVVVNQFYDYLLEQPNAYELLIDANQAMCEFFISQPHHYLLEAIIKGKESDFGNLDGRVRHQATYRALEFALKTAGEKSACSDQTQEPFIGVRNGYVRELGRVIGQAAKALFQQYLSEDLVFSPPILSRFEQKLQAVAYGQLRDFLNELSEPVEGVEASYSLLKSQLMRDIAYFEGNEASDIVVELANYFKARYDSLTVS